MATAAERREGAEILVDRTIRRALYSERVKAQAAADAVQSANRRLFPQITRLVEARLAELEGRGQRLSALDRARLDRLFGEVAGVTAAGVAAVQVRAQADAEETEDEETALIAGLLALALGRERARRLPARARLRERLRREPIAGATLPEHFAGTAARLTDAVRTTVRAGVAAGESDSAIVARLRGTREQALRDGVYERTRRAIEAAVRAVQAHAAAQAAEEVAGADPEVDRVVWIATLDSRACVRCMALHGRAFALGEGPRPPLHGSCRCRVAPVPAGVSPPPVPHFGDWLRRQSAAVQDEALGAERGALFRRGGLDVRDFVDRRGRVLTLEDLRRIDRDAFERAGL